MSPKSLGAGLLLTRIPLFSPPLALTMPSCWWRRSSDYSGTFSITNGASTLSGTFEDSLFGAGGALTLAASDAVAGEIVDFTSNVIPANLLADPQAIAFSFADVTPAVSLDWSQGIRRFHRARSPHSLPPSAALRALRHLQQFPSRPRWRCSAARLLVSALCTGGGVSA